MQWAQLIKSPLSRCPQVDLEPDFALKTHDIITCHQDRCFSSPHGRCKRFNFAREQLYASCDTCGTSKGISVIRPHLSQGAADHHDAVAVRRCRSPRSFCQLTQASGSPFTGRVRGRDQWQQHCNCTPSPCQGEALLLLPSRPARSIASHLILLRISFVRNNPAHLFR